VLAPQLPTLEESGLKNIEIVTWHALLAPAATPSAIIEKLRSEIRRDLFTPALRDKLGRDGIEVIASAPAELDAFMRADLARWKRVIEAARIRAD